MEGRIGKQQWVTHKGYYQQFEDSTVIEASYHRIKSIFSKVDTPIVSFSGGKDSTVLLFMTLSIAEELDRLPLKVLLFDEEVLDPDTLDYCAQVRLMPDIEFYWVCVPIRHTVRSKFRSFWWTWDPAEKDRWARPIPDYAISEMDGWPAGDQALDTANSVFIDSIGAEWGKVATMTGIRVDESFNRRRTILQSGAWHHNRGKRIIYAKPIYDWKWQDVWRAIDRFDWPYSKFYEKMFMAGVSPHYQRVAPWGNVSQARDVQYWPQFYPDFWDKAIRRLPELTAQHRYGSTKLYREAFNKPDHMTWMEYTFFIIASFEEEKVRKYWLQHVKETLMRWSEKNTYPFPDEPILIDGKPESLKCWKRLATIISKNDMTGRDKS